MWEHDLEMIKIKKQARSRSKNGLPFQKWFKLVKFCISFQRSRISSDPNLGTMCPTFLTTK